MERECGVDDVGAHLAHQERELVSRGVQVVGQDGAVDGEQGLGAREADSEGREVPLQNKMTAHEIEDCLREINGYVLRLI